MSRGSQDWICDPFYQELPPAERLSFHSGQMYWALVVYPTDRPQVLTVHEYDPQEQRVRFALVNYTSSLQPHYPVASLGLESDEFLVVQQGKRRPVIVLAGVNAEWLVGKKPQKLYLCAPVFSFKDLHSQEFILRLQAFCYPNLFYLPSGNPGIADESAVRLELTQPIQKGALQPMTALSGQPLALSQDAHAFFFNHLSKFLFSRPHEQFLQELTSQYREELLRAAGISGF